MDYGNNRETLEDHEADHPPLRVVRDDNVSVAMDQADKGKDRLAYMRGDLCCSGRKRAEWNRIG